MDYSIQIIDTNELRLKVENETLADSILSLIDDKYIKEINKFWVSKYNSYVVYDYEPFCTGGFDIQLDIQFKDFNHMNYAKFQIEKYLSEIKRLEDIYMLSIDLRLKENRIIKELREA